MGTVEKCPRCGEYVLVSDMTAHLTANCQTASRSEAPRKPSAQEFGDEMGKMGNACACLPCGCLALAFLLFLIYLIA